MSDSDGPGRRSKVARLIETYDLDGLGAELERKWTATGDERASLRDLAELFNRRVLAGALRAAGGRPLDGEVENLYRLLEDPDAGAADRTRARRRLEREGVDVDALAEEFVSYQAIRTYLTRHRDVSYEPEGEPATAGETIARLQSRLETVTEDKLSGARDRGEITLGESDVTVAVLVACRDCGRQLDVGTLLAEGGCECE
jgi:hypothetical protein